MQIKHNPRLITSRHIRQLTCALFFMYVLAGVPSVHAQFLKVGPFLFDAEARLEGVYTTNVEGQRKSEAEREGVSREDYFLVTGLKLNSSANVFYNTLISIDSGIAIEKHFKRPDLDNSENPFGEINIDLAFDYRHLVVNSYFRTYRASESKTDTFIQSNKKKRAVNNELGYGGGVAWQMRTIEIYSTYSFGSIRYEDKAFKSGDEDQTHIVAGTRWQPKRLIGLFYEYSDEQTDLVTKDESDSTVTEQFGFIGSLHIWERPSIDYTLGYENKDKNGKKTQGPSHSLSVSDALNLTRPDSRLQIKAFANYNFKKDIDTDDEVKFIYGVEVRHELGKTAVQELLLSQQPVRTFGSTKDSEESRAQYSFKKEDLFLYNLTGDFYTRFTRDDPKGDPELELEKKWEWGIKIDYKREMTRKIERKLVCYYEWEKSNLEPEVLDEFRISLEYSYQF